MYAVCVYHELNHSGPFSFYTMATFLTDPTVLLCYTYMYVPYTV